MEYLSELLPIFGGAVAGCISGYSIAYIRQKAKNKALKEDIAQLEEEKQKVQTKYAKEIENLKSENAFQADLKIIRYRDKKDVFTKFFTQLDELIDSNQDSFLDEYKSVFRKFIAKYEPGDESVRKEATEEFVNGISLIFDDIKANRRSFLGETNSIRLFASTELEELLDRITNENDDLIDAIFTELLKIIANPDLLLDNGMPLRSQENIDKCEEAIRESQRLIREQMKKELDQV